MAAPPSSGALDVLGSERRDLSAVRWPLSAGLGQSTAGCARGRGDGEETARWVGEVNPTPLDELGDEER